MKVIFCAVQKRGHTKHKTFPLPPVNNEKKQQGCMIN